MMHPKFESFRTLQFFFTQSDWIRNRMLFISGPRQVGKTTLVASVLCPKKETCFNWDNRKVRLAYQKDADFFTQAPPGWICFDEIHKRPKWKDILKGIYDSHKDLYHFVVIGSARLETFQKSGDSLVGRYFHTHLFPLNLGDFHRNDFCLPASPSGMLQRAADLKDSTAFEDLVALGGFPEPFFSSSQAFWKRWSNNHQDLILHEDVRDLSRVVEIDKIEALLQMLSPSIGHTLSYRNMALDLETTHGSIRRWLTILNKVQLVFSVSPYFKNIRRAFKQERKWYYMDWRAAEKNRFENYVATSLLRAVTLYADRFGERMSLCFVRTHDGAEVDFLICRDKRPWLLVEAKEGTPDISSAVYRFSHELKIPACVVTNQKNVFKTRTGTEGQKVYCLSWSKLGQLLP